MKDYSREFFTQILQNGNEINLSNQSLNGELLDFAAVLKENKNFNLKSLDLRKNQIDNETVFEIFDALPASVENLYLQSNKISDDVTMYIASYLEKEGCPLRVVNIGENNIGEDGINILSGSLSKNSNLEVLGLEKMNFSEESFKNLTEALEKNTAYFEDSSKYGGIRVLYLKENQINDEGAGYLGKLLKVNNTIEALHLDEQKFGHDIFTLSNEGAKNIFEALEVNNGLRKLSLAGNERIDDDSIFPNKANNLLKAIRKHIEEENYESKVGADYSDINENSLLSALIKNKTLIDLDLRGTSITDIGVELLCGLILSGANTTILNLEVGDNISEGWRKILKDALEGNKRKLNSNNTVEADSILEEVNNVYGVDEKNNKENIEAKQTLDLKEDKQIEVDRDNMVSEPKTISNLRPGKSLLSHKSEKAGFIENEQRLKEVNTSGGGSSEIDYKSRGSVRDLMKNFEKKPSASPQNNLQTSKKSVTSSKTTLQIDNS